MPTVATGSIAVACIVALVSCSGQGPAPAPSASVPEHAAGAFEESAAPQSQTVGEWRTLLAAPPREAIAWATATPDGRVAAMTAAGMKVVRGDGWLPAPSLRIEPPSQDAFEVREDCHVVRRRDGRDYGPPREHDYRGYGPEPCVDALRAGRVFEGADGHPIARVGPGHILRWSAERRRMGHVYPDTPGGPVALVVRPVGGGWQSVSGPIRSPIASVVPLDPPMLVTEDGDVLALEPGTDFDRARPIVTVPRPRPLLLLELDSGALLVARADGVRVIARDGAARELITSGDALAWLERSARGIEEGSALRVLGASLGRGRAILGAGTGLVYVEGDRATFFSFGESGETPGWVGEVWGLVASDEDAGWLALTHNGVVVRGRAAGHTRASSLAELHPDAVSHPIGAFRGADGRARLLEEGRPISCASLSASSVRLEPCGPAVDSRPQRAHALRDALVIDDQSIDLHLVTTGGPREIPLPLPRRRHVFHGGRADAVYALTDGIVQRLNADAWHPVASLPAGAPEPRCFAVTSDDRLVVGLAGGEVIFSSR